ncbi:MAG: ABC transporter permease [Muribaculaceae bacterium]|nr:ABC transporter permease [Muribaculaceae bacterium]
MSKIGIVIEREYMERVRKKSFIFTTILMPLLMLALMALPALMMTFIDGSETRVLVVDNSGVVATKLTDTDEVKFKVATPDVTQDSALMADGHDAVLVIPSNIIDSKHSSLKVFSDGPASMITEGTITRQINEIVEKERLSHYEIENLDKILDEVESNVSISTIRTDKDSEEALSSGLSYGIGIGMSFILYMFILIYGQMVMTSIIEEKGNRVLEVVVTSVKPMQLMLGKIIGVALVALTQILLWGILLSVMSGFILPALLPTETMADITAIQSGNMASVSNQESLEMTQALASLTQVGDVISLVALMTVFLILGFLVYSSIFVAIGSAVDNIQDASQLSSFAVFPIVFGLIFSMTAAADPSGPIAFWSSLFPLTAPMVMVARIPFGIPSWEIVLSIVLLVISFLFFVWMAGKIYRVGIFMYGKKPSVKEIIKWTRYK